MNRSKTIAVASSALHLFLFAFVEPERYLIFVKNKESADWVSASLSRRHWTSMMIHDHLNVTQLNDAVDEFTMYTCPIIVTTQLAAAAHDRTWESSPNKHPKRSRWKMQESYEAQRNCPLPADMTTIKSLNHIAFLQRDRILYPLPLKYLWENALQTSENNYHPLPPPNRHSESNNERRSFVVHLRLLLTDTTTTHHSSKPNGTIERLVRLEHIGHCESILHVEEEEEEEEVERLFCWSSTTIVLCKWQCNAFVRSSKKNWSISYVDLLSSPSIDPSLSSLDQSNLLRSFDTSFVAFVHSRSSTGSRWWQRRRRRRSISSGTRQCSG